MTLLSGGMVLFQKYEILEIEHRNAVNGCCTFETVFHTMNFCARGLNHIKLQSAAGPSQLGGGG